MKIYAGIGSRKTPPDTLRFMTEIATWLDQKWILRSGGAQGADSAFERGSTHKEIFYASSVTTEAIELAYKFHPLGERLKYKGDYIVSLMARNSFQILGKDLKSPSDLVICWTPDGATNAQETSINTGGTGQAIRMASAYGIKVYNLACKDHYDFIRGKMDKRG